MNQYIQRSEELYNALINKKDVEIDKYGKLIINDINVLLKELEYTYQEVKKFYDLSNKFYNTTTNNIVDIYRSFDSNNVTNDQNMNNMNNMNIFSNINIQCDEIDSLQNLPNCRLYWIKNIKQFAIKINNNIIRGNKADIKFNGNANDMPCNCTKLEEKKNCANYHDPMHLITNKDNIPIDVFLQQLNKNRSFNYNSWYYSTNFKLTKKNTKIKRYYIYPPILKYKLTLMKNTYDKNLLEDYVNTIGYQIINDLLYYLILYRELIK